MNRALGLIIAKCIFIGLVFTFVIYSLNFEYRIVRYLWIFAFYFAIYLLFSFKSKQNFSKYFLPVAILLTPVLIDASVLITAPNLAPLRFPFASTFSILGVFTGFVFKYKSRLYLFFYTVLIFFYFILCYLWIIPRIIYSMETNEVSIPKLKASFYSSRFITSNMDTVVLSDNFSNHTIVDLFFVGCPPCEEKKEMFYEVAKEDTVNNFKILMICDGLINTLEIFKHFVKRQKTDPHILYLYDYNNVIKRDIGDIKGFPYEMVFKGKIPIKLYKGFNNETKQFMIAERLKLITEK